MFWRYQSRARWSPRAGGVGFIHNQKNVCILLFEGRQSGEIRDISVHTENGFCDDDGGMIGPMLLN